MNAFIEMDMYRANEMHDFVASRLAGKYPHDDRRALLAAFVSLAQSHHEAILLLAGQKQLVSSAFALFRPMVEAAYRGLFVAFLATDEQIETIKDDGEPYGHFNKLANALDDKFQTDGLYLQYAGDAWKTLNGYTHGGLEQLARRINEEGMLGDHFDAEEIQGLLASSTSLLTRTVIPFLQVMDRSDAAHAVSMRYLELYPLPGT
jgi:hypothetical protein